MRFSVSCFQCRNSKVKCVHEGSPPCRGCSKAGRSGCQLTPTRSAPGQKSATSRQQAPNSRRNWTKRPSPPSIQRDDMATSPRNIILSSDRNIDSHLSQLSPSVVIRACTLLKQIYPAADVIHLPSVYTTVLSEDWKIDTVFTACLMALCAPLLPGEGLLPSEEYASYVYQALSNTVFESPSLETVQCLLMISLYDFRVGHVYKAWMYIGLGTRMAEGLLSSAPNTNTYAEGRGDTNQMQLNRLYWSCTLQDRLINAGCGQRSSSPLSLIDVPLPAGNHDFVFGRKPGRTWTIKEIYDAADCISPPRLSIDHSLSLIVCGHDILLNVMSFVRKQKIARTASSPEEIMPWMPESPWFSLNRDLQTWRNLQESSVQFPVTSVYAHIQFGNCETFTYINLIYYLSLLLLHQQHIPFFSGRCNEPTVLCNQDPDQHDSTWWSESAKQLSQAAENITDILVNLDRAGKVLGTPFAGFCCFSACMINLYLAAFPTTLGDYRTRAKELVQSNFRFLDVFRQSWNLGKPWWSTIHETQSLYNGARKENKSPSKERQEQYDTIAASPCEYANIRQPQNDASSSRIPQNAKLGEMNLHSDTLNQERYNPPSGSLWSSISNDEVISFDLDGAGNNANEWNSLWNLWENDGINFFEVDL